MYAAWICYLAIADYTKEHSSSRSSGTGPQSRDLHATVALDPSGVTTMMPICRFDNGQRGMRPARWIYGLSPEDLHGDGHWAKSQGK